MAYFTTGASVLEFNQKTLLETVLTKLDPKKFNLGDVLQEVSPDLIASLSFQSIMPKEVLLKALVAWLMADDVGKAALLVCSMSGNKHARLLKKGRVDAARFLSPIVVDTAKPTDLTLGRFAISLGCVFHLNVEGWSSKNSGHSGFSATFYERYYYNFLNVQITSWKTYNPTKELTKEVITKSANIMNQQRSSCVLFLEERNPPFLAAMSEAEFIALHKLVDYKPPAHNASPPCCTPNEVQEAFKSLTTDDIRHITVRSQPDEKVFRWAGPGDGGSSSSSSSEPKKVKVRKTTMRHASKTYKAQRGGSFDESGFYLDSEGRMVVNEDNRALSIDELIDNELIVEQP